MIELDLVSTKSIKDYLLNPNRSLTIVPTLIHKHYSEEKKTNFNLD